MRANCARQCYNANVRTASVQSDSTDPRTTACRHLADALVVVVGHKHVAARINGQTIEIVEAGVGAGRVGIRPVGATDPARKR